MMKNVDFIDNRFDTKYLENYQGWCILYSYGGYSYDEY
jgi:hypothetical protein